MVDVNVQPIEIEVRTRHGDLVRADVYLPRDRSGPFPVLLGASAYQKSLRRLPPHWVFPFIEYGPMQLYLDEGYAYVVMDVPGTGRSEGTWGFVSRTEGEAIHDMYRDWMYHGGMPVEMFLDAWLFGAVLTQHLWQGHDIRGGGRAELVYDILSHPHDDDCQRRRSPFWELDQIDIPVLSIGVWGKSSLHLRGNFTGFERVRGPRQLVITPPDSFAGAQTQYADPDFHRRELSSESSGAVRSLNDGSLLDEKPSGTADTTSWSYPDPKWMAGVTTFDETGRPDHVARVNTFTSHPLERDREFTGRGVLVLHASSYRADPDVVSCPQGERIRLEISNTDSMITDAPMTHFYGQKVGTDTYHHDAAYPSRLRLHERPRTQPGEPL